MEKYLYPILIVLGLLGLCGAAPTGEQLEKERAEFYTYAIGEFVPVQNYILSRYIDFGHSFLNDHEFKQVKDQDVLKPIVANLSSIIDELDRVNRTTYPTPIAFVYDSAKAIKNLTDCIETYTSWKNAEKYNEIQKEFAKILREKYIMSPRFTKESEKRVQEFDAKFLPRYDTLVNTLATSDYLKYMMEDFHRSILKKSRDEYEFLYHVYAQMFVDYYEETMDEK